MKDQEFDPENEKFIAKLARASAAELPLDPHVVFYQAGYAAAQAQFRIRLWRMGSVATAASLAALCFVATLAYRAGSTGSSSILTSQKSPVVQANNELVDRQLINKKPVEGSRSSEAQSDLTNASPAVENRSPNQSSSTGSSALAVDVVASDSWWALWVPSEFQPISRSGNTPFQNDESISFAGLDSFSNQTLDLRARGAKALDASTQDGTVEATSFISAPRLNPRDWKSLLPML